MSPFRKSRCAESGDTNTCNKIICTVIFALFPLLALMIRSQIMNCDENCFDFFGDVFQLKYPCLPVGHMMTTQQRYQHTETYKFITLSASLGWCPVLTAISSHCPQLRRVQEKWGPFFKRLRCIWSGVVWLILMFYPMSRLCIACCNFAHLSQLYLYLYWLAEKKKTQDVMSPFVSGRPCR